VEDSAVDVVAVASADVDEVRLVAEDGASKRCSSSYHCPPMFAWRIGVWVSGSSGTFCLRFTILLSFVLSLWRHSVRTRSVGLDWPPCTMLKHDESITATYRLFVHLSLIEVGVD
jgi:hypothetical protein